MIIFQKSNSAELKVCFFLYGMIILFYNWERLYFMESKIVNLDNGIELYYKKNADTPRVALCFNCSINEPENIPGINSLMTRLFMQGTTTYSAEELAEELDKYAIEFAVELKHDYLRFKFVALNEDFPKAVDIMTDIVKNTTFDDFNKEREKMRGEIIAELDASRTKVLENYYKNLYEGHYYGHTYTKILENIDKINKDDVINAYKKIISNSKKVMSFVGDLQFEDVFKELNEKLGDVENSKDEKIGLSTPQLNEKKELEIIKPDLNQAHIVQGWFVPGFNEEDYHALLLLNIILGASGLSSRLFLELRDKKGLAYVVRSSYETLSLAANFSIYIATEPKNIEVSLQGFKEEIDKVKNIPVSLEELDNARNNILGKWAFLQENNNQQATLSAHYAVIGLGFDFNEKTKQRIKEVTPEQIQSCAQKYFNDKYVLSILKP